MKNLLWYSLLTILAIITITACEDLPVASFTISSNTVAAWDTVYFHSTSENADDFDWDFGDGNGSTQENPSHVYTVVGTYEILLVVSNKDGSDEASSYISISPPSGYAITATVHSPGLEGNLLGDSPDRPVTIYLPPGYYNSPDKRYPVVYFLHGYTSDHTRFFGGSDVKERDFKLILDDLIYTNAVHPMIVVSPNSNNYYDGSWYTNSHVTGQWEDFIVKDVVQYMDDNYRTLASRESRGIAGHSMGGYGTIMIVMKNPDVFSAAYSLSGACLVFEELILGSLKSWVLEAANAENLSDMTWHGKSEIAQAAAFAPDSTAPPYYGHLPLTKTGGLIDSIWQIWIEHDPYTMLPAYKDNLLQLTALQFDCGKLDQFFFYLPTVHFSEALDSIGIDHVFEEYDGDHSDKLTERIRVKLLPFFSANLEHD